jgi:hypothetical protein
LSARGIVTAVGAVVFLGVGFAVSAFASAYLTRESYAEPWRKMRVEHEGADDKPTRTRVVFENPKLAVQAVEVLRSAEGRPSLARVSLRDGEELTLTYGDDDRALTLTGPDGAYALFEFDSERGHAHVTFFTPEGKEVATTRLMVPIQLLAHTNPEASDTEWAHLWDDFGIATAHAKDAVDEDVSVTREVVVSLDLSLVGADAKPGAAQIEVSCAPLTCVPLRREIASPSVSDVVISVSGSVKRSALGGVSRDALDTFVDEAKRERKAARRALPEVARVIGTLGMTAIACESLALSAPICVRSFGSRPGSAGGAVQSVLHHTVESDSGLIDERAEKLYLEQAARRALDGVVRIEVCAARDGFGRACTTVAGQPLGETPLAKSSRAIALRRGVGGALAGTFAMSQSDGADCKFSPSPRTAGAMKLTFDNERNTVSASMTANERGSRPNMQCSLGTANMGWSQNYGIQATQTFTAAELTAGGKLPVRLKGTMSGTGSYSFSNCRTSGGASANCPPGKGDTYSYPVEVTGTIDLDSRTGSGQIIVANAPLATQGTWRVPGETKP